jgi:hypothetical protein
VKSFEEAIALANDTPYGLAASIFTANAKRAIRGARAIRAGTVTVNCFGEGDITTPFGGFKQSGFGGRDNGAHAHDQYTQLKTIWLDLSDDADEADDRAMIALNRHAIAFAARRSRNTRSTRILRPAGKVNGAASAAADAHNAATRRISATLGEASEMLDAQAMRDLTGSAHYRSGLYTPGTVMLQPAGYIRGLAAGLAGEGVASMRAAPVTGMRRARASAWRVETTGGHRSARARDPDGQRPSRKLRLRDRAADAAVPLRGDDAEARRRCAARGSAGGAAGASRRRTRWARPSGGSTAGQGGNRIVTRTCATLRPGRQAGAGDMWPARPGDAGQVRRALSAACRDARWNTPGRGTCASR